MRRKRLALLLAAALTLALPAGVGTTVTVSQAKGIKVTSQVELSKKKMTIVVGKAKKLTMENSDYKVDWTMDKESAAKIRFKKVTDDTVTIEGLKKGKVNVYGFVSGKTYTCAVNVKKAKAAVTTADPTASAKTSATPKATATPKASKTPKPSASPKASATPKTSVAPTATPKASASPKASSTPKATATPKPTKTPKPTATPTYTKAPPVVVDDDMVAIGHASINENAGIKNGIPGDQTGREVYIKAWYVNGWNKMVRCDNEKVANLIATYMEQACANDNIGYAQDKRDTCFIEAEKVKWVLKKIKTACEADCSSLVRVCVNCAYYAYDKSLPFADHNDTFYTGNMASELKKTGHFKVYTASKYLSSSDYLKRGDILVAEGHHTVVVLKDGAKVK